MSWEPVIGLEVHVQLRTASKAFSASSAEFGAEPNSHTNPTVLGLPGALPVFNARALELALRLGVAAGCTIRPRSRFARKHYFYPDLPKGYQISQYDEPLCAGGAIELAGGGAVPLTRIHLEEDAGKSMHAGAVSLVDLNRAGVPLVEVVSEPALRSAEAAGDYMRALRQLVRWLGVSEGNMEQGQLRCDANVSLRPAGATALGTRTELKNINSFRFVEKAITHEIERQARILAGGGRVVQETRLWDADAGMSHPMRSKEEAEDYRYFPDPDLPPLAVAADDVDRVRAGLPELPVAAFRKLVDRHGLSADDARTLTAERELYDWYSAAVAAYDGGKPKNVANWILSQPDIAGSKLPPAELAGLVRLIDDGTISGKIAKDVFATMMHSAEPAAAIVDREGLRQVVDSGALRAACEKVVAANPKQAEQYRAGNRKLHGFFVGQVMKETGGKANPAVVNQLLAEILGMTDEIFSPLRWKGDVLYLIDQLRLPAEEMWLTCRTADDVARAIRDMHVRGAPAIGCAAAYGVALAARQIAAEGATPMDFQSRLDGAIELLAATRPTAVNLFWALAQMRNAAVVALEEDGVAGAAEALARRAAAIHNEDVAMCQRIGKFGAELIPDGATVLTHCNAGALATGGYGTALGVLRAARESGKKLRIFADETRPFLQGARLTAWELLREGFDVTIIPDASAAFFLRRGEISCVIVGADRIAANGDVANKIGTYGVALAAAAHRVPFYVAAPTSTIDRATATGADIPIEERSGSEMLTVGNTQIAPRGAVGRYPAFDVTPAELVSAIITDRGVARAPYGAALAKAFEEE